MSGKRILVVEDGITMRMFYQDVLGRAGFVVEEATNGVEGLEKALLGGYDLMIVDINMPKMDGYELVSRIRREPSLQATPVVTISTEAQDADASRAYEVGANFYIVKPADPVLLVETARLLTGAQP
ncbi:MULTISPECIES: response regulator [unclassified Methylobacterium]|uniref:response regulator n=1 Tax=unclassified Methylobacterium TaxID=2615210 RepID=UPI0011C1D66A|nr:MULTISPECIES: response regulator [unclassified Methylobacterium]QEE41110.1 response regulator [Methylobacterium sp. WL1]TXM98317.1 response regulator [Methylobacterium sp. WL64]TXN58967.1 response regulator [Methylobacterium sp. WL2]